MKKLKNNKGVAFVTVLISITFITILAVLVVGLGCALGYVLLNKDTEVKEETKKVEEKENVTVEQEKEETGDNSVTQNSVTTETRSCIGVYSGAVTGAHSPGELTVELKASGVYLVNGYETGTYKIIDNALLLITHSDVCGSGKTCSASYDLGTISDDCNTMYWPYQGNKFEFTRQN